MNNLHCQIHSVPASTPSYTGSISDTITVNVDNKTREISAELNSNLVKDIELTRRQVIKTNDALANYALVEEVETSLNEVKNEYLRSDKKLENNLLEKINALEALIHQLVPIQIKSIHSNTSELLEAGTPLTQLKLDLQLNKIAKSATAKIEDYVIDISDSDSTSLQLTLDAEYEDCLENCIIDFGDTIQCVTDDFFNMLSHIGEWQEQRIETIGDRETGYIEIIDAPTNQILDIEDILIIGSEKD